MQPKWLLMSYAREGVVVMNEKGVEKGGKEWKMHKSKKERKSHSNTSESGSQ
jgi:hypothetical protein